MNYIWDNYSDDNVYEIGGFSPCLEETGTKVAGKRLVNPLFRFAIIFDPLLQLYGVNEKFRDRTGKSLENIFFHHLAQLDRKSGIRIFSIQEYLVERDILDGCYGEEIRNTYAELNFSEQVIIKKFLRLHNAAEGKKSYFKQVLNRVFPVNASYWSEEDKKYLIYLPDAETVQLENKLKLLVYLFMDATVSVRFFWKYHFGIIGENDTMKIGNIAIY